MTSLVYGFLLLLGLITTATSTLYTVLFMLGMGQNERDFHISMSFAALTLFIAMVWVILEPWLTLLYP